MPCPALPALQRQLLQTDCMELCAGKGVTGRQESTCTVTQRMQSQERPRLLPFASIPWFTTRSGI